MDSRLCKRATQLVAFFLISVLLAAGCTGKRKTNPGAEEGADSAAYAQIQIIEDDGARLAALRYFVKERTTSVQAGEAYVDLIDLARAKDSGAVPRELRAFLKVDFESPGPYNAIGWSLAEAGEHLGFAVEILEKAVAKARAQGDGEMLASCLDSEAWARYRKGDHANAVARMEEAYKIFGAGNDEIDEHMALIYDAAGMEEKAKPIYLDLLSHMESPHLRENLNRIIRDAGESQGEIDAEISRRREAGATEAPDFTLPKLASGEEVSLKDFRGRIVLLNFWHPT